MEIKYLIMMIIVLLLLVIAPGCTFKPDDSGPDSFNTNTSPGDGNLPLREKLDVNSQSNDDSIRSLSA